MQIHAQGNTHYPAPQNAIYENVARTMSSREIAALTGKRHPDVKRDIASMASDLGEDARSFAHIYLDSMNREQTEYLLDREHTDCLLTGYSAAMRMAVIKRWHELEGRQVGTLQIPGSFAEALRLAASLQEQIDKQAPQVAAIKRLASAQGAICITDAAKQLQLEPGFLFAWLQENRWIYRRQGSRRWIGYQPRINTGVITHKVTALKPDPETGAERAAFDPLITPRGLTVLAQHFSGAKL